MGRYISEGGEIVHKYVFAKQPSEMVRIHTKLGIGKYERPEDDIGDYLTLTRDDKKVLDEYLTEEIEIRGIEKIDHEPITREKILDMWGDLTDGLLDEGIPVGGIKEEILDMLRNNLFPDLHFWLMVKRFRDYMEENDKDEYVFYGEF